MHMNLKLGEEAKERLAREAERTGMTRTALVKIAIVEYLDGKAWDDRCR